MNSVTFVVDSIDKNGFALFARETRLALGYSPEVEFGREEISKNFDGGAVVEFIYNISENLSPLLTGLAAYVIARRGEIRVKIGENEYHFKNIKKSDVFDIIEKIRDADQDDQP